MSIDRAKRNTDREPLTNACAVVPVGMTVSSNNTIRDDELYLVVENGNSPAALVYGSYERPAVTVDHQLPNAKGLYQLILVSIHHYTARQVGI